MRRLKDGVEPVDVGIACQHQRIATDASVLGRDLHPVPDLLIGQCAGLLQNLPAGPLDGSGQPQRQLERIQMRALRVQQAGQITVAADPVGQRRALYELQPLIAPLLRRMLLPLMQQLNAPRQYGGPQMAGTVVAIETVAPRQRLDLGRSPAHQIPQMAGILITERRLQRVHVARPAQYRHAAVAPAGGPAYPAGLDQGDALAGQCQPQRGVQAGKSGADDQHLGIELIRLRWP